MFYEVIIEGYVLQVDVTHCVNEPAAPNTWSSDWDGQGCRDIEFKVVEGNTYNRHGARRDINLHQCELAGKRYADQIMVQLWEQIDSRRQRERWAA